ncbi:MAG: hypothetical protein Q9217_006476 [Psora testacea]
MQASKVLSRLFLVLAFMTVCNSLALSAKFHQTPANNTQSTIPSRFTYSVEHSWTGFVEYGLGILSQRFPTARPIGVVTSSSTDVSTVALLRKYAIVADDPQLGNLVMRGRWDYGWNYPQETAGESHTLPTLAWPPPFDIHRALELSRGVGYGQTFCWVQLEDDESAPGQMVYIFRSDTGHPTRWYVRTTDGSVVSGQGGLNQQGREWNGTVTNSVNTS